MAEKATKASPNSAGNVVALASGLVPAADEPGAGRASLSNSTPALLPPTIDCYRKQPHGRLCHRNRPFVLVGATGWVCPKAAKYGGPKKSRGGVEATLGRDRGRAALGKFRISDDLDQRRRPPPLIEGGSALCARELHDTEIGSGSSRPYLSLVGCARSRNPNG